MTLSSITKSTCFALALLAGSLSLSASAEENHETRISSIIMQESGKAFVYFETPSATPPQCGASRAGRAVFKVDDIATQAMLSVILTAKMQDKLVRVYLLDTCSVHSETRDLSWVTYFD